MKPDDTRKQQVDDLRAVMDTPSGRRFLWRVLTQAGVFSASYAQEANATAYNEGRRSIGIALLREVQTQVPELYIASLREDLDRIETERKGASKEKDAE